MSTGICDPVQCILSYQWSAMTEHVAVQIKIQVKQSGYAGNFPGHGRQHFRRGSDSSGWGCLMLTPVMERDALVLES